MEREEALKLLDEYTEKILSFLQTLSPEAKVYYLSNLCKPTGKYCSQILGNPGAPLTHHNLLYLALNLCLDIEEDIRKLGKLGIPYSTLDFYNKINPILSVLIANR